MGAEDKRFFIAKDNEIRWIKVFITQNVEFDNHTEHIVVSMGNNLNAATSPKDCLIEGVDIKDCFGSVREAQLEIIIRERFDKK